MVNDIDSVTADKVVANIKDKHDSDVVDAVMDHVDIPHLVDRLEGRDGGLRPSKPTASGDDGLTQYVWRMARFHSGDDPKMPVTASWWLSSWVSDHGIDASVSGVLDDDGKAVNDALGDVVTVILLLGFKRDPTGGAKRWKGLLF